MLEMRTEITIDGSPEDVWTRLMDFERYGEWNPFVREIAGPAVVGERLDIELTPPGGRPTRIHPRVLVVEPGREFRWIGVLGTGAIMSGEHVFELHADGTGTRLVHWERFRGLLARTLIAVVGKKTRAGFEEMNAALKRRVETGEGFPVEAEAGVPAFRAC